MTNLFSKTQSAALALAVGIAGAVLITAPSAHATVTITPGVSVEPGEEVITFGTAQSGTTLTGTTDLSSTAVQFTSTQALEAVAGSGELNAALPATSITGDITAASSGNTFQDFIFNALVGTGAAGGA